MHDRGSLANCMHCGALISVSFGARITENDCHKVTHSTAEQLHWQTLKK
jgi:hypothetical protein